MFFLPKILKNTFIRRMPEIEYSINSPFEVQEKTLASLISQARNTYFGGKYGFKEIKNYDQFCQRVPINTYEEFYPYIEKMLKGEQNITWHSNISWFAKSSGTTNNQSKFIPVSKEALINCHYKGGKDLITMYFNNYPDSKIFQGKGLVIGGSQKINAFDKTHHSRYGDISAVIAQNLPFWAKIGKVPSTKITLMEDWEEKIEKIARITYKKNITNIYGVPTWTIVLLQKILELTGKNCIHDVWENLELFVHGAVAFEPYEPIFRQLTSASRIRYIETYNASEGFFAIQDQKNFKDMLLLLNHGVFYEFIPVEHLDNKQAKAICLDKVELNKSYALVITTNAGLWRYLIGDVVKFTSKKPYRVKIVGRTKHFMNAFGEEVVIENAEIAIKKACEKTNATIHNFTAAPQYFSMNNHGLHEWVIEFKQKPKDKDLFINELDKTLQNINSDYQAKRYKDIILKKPVIHFAKESTFYQWMKSKNKLGGQHKVPRLTNTREYIDEILNFMTKSCKK